MATRALASATHTTALRGGAGGGPTVARAEPPGLHRPEASHPAADRPEPRATLLVVPVAGSGREWLNSSRMPAANGY